MRFSILVQTLAVSSAISLSAFFQLPAQDLAARVARAPDGVVRVQFASRPGTCGDGRDAIGFRKAFFAENFQSIGSWDSPNCSPGPVRVALSVAGGQVTRIRTSVGATWPQTSERVTDLGAVSPVEAASYFFALVPRIERPAARDKSRILLPAVLADAGDVIPQLTSLARDPARTDDTKRQAILWLGLLGDAKVVPTLVAFARGGGGGGSVSDDPDEDDSRPGAKGLAAAAMAALTYVADGAGVPALIDIARNGSAGSRKSAVFWLGQTGDPRAIAMLHSVIENASEDERVRSNAIFALSHGEAPASEFAYLRGIFPRLPTNKLKEQVLMGMGEDKSNGSAWLIAKARDTGEPLTIRKSALFWAGQRDLTPTRDLVAVYRSSTELSLKEHAIFVLSQRDDKESVDELMQIAQSDADKRMRSKAMFWLGQKDDPRVTKFIGDRIAR